MIRKIFKTLIVGLGLLKTFKISQATPNTKGYFCGKMEINSIFEIKIKYPSNFLVDFIKSNVMS